MQSNQLELTFTKEIVKPQLPQERKTFVPTQIKQVFLINYSCSMCQHFHNCQVLEHTDIKIATSNCLLFQTNENLKPIK